MTEINRDVIAKGHAAKHELTETEDAFARVRAALVAKLWGSTLDQSEERERLFMAVQALDAVRTVMREAVDAGVYEQSISDNFTYKST